MNFGQALEHLKAGERVQRVGWNGKGMWLGLVEQNGYSVYGDDGEPLMEVGRGDYKLLPWIGMKTADGGFVPWLASQTDILAEDWQTFTP